MDNKKSIPERKTQHDGRKISKPPAVKPSDPPPQTPKPKGK